MSRIRHPRRAFTLIELLVVVAIIAILVSLLMPAVQSAREAAARAQCMNNLKQIGLALSSYEGIAKAYPPGSMWRTTGDIQTAKNAKLGENWVILILPHLEKQALYNSINFQKFMPDAANATARATPLAIMRCPSDTFATVPFNGTGSNQGSNWARGCYAANSALGYMTVTTHGVNSAASHLSQGWNDKRLRGVMGANTSSTVSEISDGLSNTVFVAEVRAGVVPIDARGTWAMSGGGSSLWAHGYVGDASGPNSLEIEADDVERCSEIQAAMGGATALVFKRMPCSSGGYPNFQQSARSMHADGVMSLFGDGSVHWLSESIEVSKSIAKASVWDKLMLPWDGNPLSNRDY